MRPCLSLNAFAQTSATPSSDKASTVSTLASISVPIPTTARPNSCTPRRWRVSPLVESAWTTWVSRSDHCWTISALSSMPSTSWPRRTSELATALPKRPRPITTTPSLRGDLELADNGTLLRVTVGPLLAAQSKCRGQGDCSHTPHVHQNSHNKQADG